MTREAFLFPDKRTTFGVVEMTTGCGRRCQFCLPDLNPQIDMPQEKILAAVRANVRDGNTQISLATEDMFIWGQVRTGTPFYFPNREASLELYEEVVNTPGVEQHVVSHATIAPAVVDPVLIERLTALMLDKSPIHLGRLSTHPAHKAIVPLIGLETGSVRMAKQIMPSKGVPFPIEEWPSVIVRGLEVLNRHNWFPAMTLIIGNPGETDEDCRETIDLICEVERRGLFAFFIPSIFTPLHDTRMEKKTGVTETRQLTPLQWQLMMKCWKMNLRPGQQSWWAPTAWRLGALGLWAWKLRELNGPGFTWPLLMFANALPERVMATFGKLHAPRPLTIKTRRELLETIKSGQRQHIRGDTGDIPGSDADGPDPARGFDPLGGLAPSQGEVAGAGA
jgi:Radical SAM superfamily